MLHTYFLLYTELQLKNFFSLIALQQEQDT